MTNYYFYFKETDIEFIDELLDKITEIADQNGVKFMYGGFGRIIMLSKEYGNYDIPDEIVDIEKEEHFFQLFGMNVGKIGFYYQIIQLSH